MFNNLKTLYSQEKKKSTEHEVQVSSSQFSLRKIHKAFRT